MPWQEVSTMSLREEFVRLASEEDVNMRDLCRRFGISPRTGYKWLTRFADAGQAGLIDRSRRPRHSPRRTEATMEEAVRALRLEHPAWGGRKLKRRLTDLGQTAVPAASTLTAILHRQDLIDLAASARSQPWIRFEHAAPNALWQMDFKGHFPVGAGRCHPLTVLDDHSRFVPCLGACADETGATVQDRLTPVFRRYGIPERMTMDNGPPWGNQAACPLTRVTVWLIRTGIRVSHSRPYHPQTQGKDERFHRTLNVEVLARAVFANLTDCQGHFDRFRDSYNLERPHEALGLATPASRYQVSRRAYPETLPPIEYAPGDIVRRVQGKGEISYRGQLHVIGKALHGLAVALRPGPEDGLLEVFFCHQRITRIDLKKPFR